MRPFHFIFFSVAMLALPAYTSDFGDRLAKAALERTLHTVVYDGRYQRIAYPGGDVADTLGVCTDVIIRIYRQLDIDLQVRVHEDMVQNFDAYPKIWGLKRTDTNIDHRRVPNLQTFFARQGARVTEDKDFRTGDILTWMLPGNLPHISIVVSPAREQSPAQIVHNIGMGPQKTGISPHWRLTGHYRYGGE